MLKYFTRAIGKYATFTGRARRKEFWCFVLVVAIIKGLLQNVHGSIFNNQAGIEEIVGLLFLVPTMAVAVRRLHDTGRSGWWLLLAPTGVGTIILFFFMIQDGMPGDNEYGPNPKGRDHDDYDERRRRNRKYRKRLKRTLKDWENDDDQYV